MNSPELFSGRLNQLRKRLADSGVDTAVITDDDSVYYYSGYYHDYYNACFDEY